MSFKRTPEGFVDRNFWRLMELQSIIPLEVEAVQRSVVEVPFGLARSEPMGRGWGEGTGWKGLGGVV